MKCYFFTRFRESNENKDIISERMLRVSAIKSGQTNSKARRTQAFKQLQRIVLAACRLSGNAVQIPSLKWVAFKLERIATLRRTVWSHITFKKILSVYSYFSSISISIAAFLIFVRAILILICPLKIKKELDRLINFKM